VKSERISLKAGRKLSGLRFPRGLKKDGEEELDSLRRLFLLLLLLQQFCRQLGFSLLHPALQDISQSTPCTGLQKRGRDKHGTKKAD
jgi:hypothetical protein